MPRTIDSAFTEFLERLTPTSTERLAAASHRQSIRSALESSLSVNSFFESGSFTHGTGVRSYSDVDAFVSLRADRPGSSDTALTWVRDALNRRFHSTPVYVSRPAVVVDFAGGGQAWEVIPAFLTGRGSSEQFIYDIPGPRGGWIDSAPKEHLAYVNEVNKIPRQGAAKGLARLMKTWKYYRDVPISSFYLEMRAARYMREQTSCIYVYDVCFLLEFLQEIQLAPMNDPKNATGRFHPCSSDANLQTALLKLRTASTRARKALDAHISDDVNSAFYYLDLLFNGNFPSRW